MFVILYGPEGSGKTTQGKLLSEKLGVPQLVSGDLVRKYATEDKGIMGEICNNALNLGHYVADSEMFVLWKARLKEKDVEKGFVLDGFPRNMSQALFLDEKLEKYGKETFMVIFLNLPEKVSIERLLKRGRRTADGKLHDSPELIKERLRRYHLEEKDVLDFYRKKGVLQEIDGQLSIEQIHNEIMHRIKETQDETD